MRRVLLLFVIVVFVLTGCVASKKISKEEYDRIEIGQDYATVMEIIGFDGKLLAESGEKCTAQYSMIYKWEGKGPMGAKAVVSFVGNKVHAKTQYQLKGSSDSNNNHTLGIEYQEFCKSFTKNWTHKEINCTCHSMDLSNSDVTFSGKHTMYEKKIWSNEDEHIIMNAKVENDKAKGEIYSVEIVLNSDKNSDEALKLYNLCKHNVLYTFVDTKLKGLPQGDIEKAIELLQDENYWGVADVEISQDDSQMKFHLKHFKN